MSDLYDIVDPRPVAASAKYTSFPPSPEELAAVDRGDLVKVNIRSVPPSGKWDSERMWVKVLSADADWLEGHLDSEPDDMPMLTRGALIRIPRSHVIDVMFSNPETARALATEPRREFWERCLVDRQVIEGELCVHYLYREEPAPKQEGHKFPDSGWRIRGDMRGYTDEEISNRAVDYVALGAVLNKDDSWLHLIDEPVGVQYAKSFDDDVFVQIDR